jgi:hypothetical protein
MSCAFYVNKKPINGGIQAAVIWGDELYKYPGRPERSANNLFLKHGHRNVFSFFSFPCQSLMTLYFEVGCFYPFRLVYSLWVSPYIFFKISYKRRVINGHADATFNICFFNIPNTENGRNMRWNWASWYIYLFIVYLTTLSIAQTITSND